MYKAFEYRIYPTEEQKTLILKHFGACRWLYNYGLERKIKYHTVKGGTLSRYTLQAELPVMKKKEDTSWLGEINSQTLQSVLIDLEHAYLQFFKGASDFPKFKVKNGKQSFAIPQDIIIDEENSRIRLPKFKTYIKTIFHRHLCGKVKTCYVKRTRTNKYFITVTVDDGRVAGQIGMPQIDNAIGIDVGIKTFVTLSNGNKIESPKYIEDEQHRLKRMQRALDRKLVKGQGLSKNASKLAIKIALAHERVVNKRKDFLHKLSTKLIRENQTICVESLGIKDIMKDSRFARAFQDLGVATFFNFLEYKADWYGKTILKCGRFAPSSKTCNACGSIKRGLTLSDRSWHCDYCGCTHDRDVNAAKNICKFAFIGIRADAELTPTC